MAAEVIKTYTERLVQVGRVFELYPDRVVVYAKWWWQKPFETRVPLASLSPECVYLQIRYRLFKHGILICAIGLALAFLTRRPEGPLLYTVLEAVGYGLAAVGFVLAVATYRRVVFARFPPREGRGGLDIAQSGPDRKDFPAFVKLVQRQIIKQRKP